MTHARRIAYDVLHDVGANDAYSNIALAHALRGSDLSAQDKGLTTDLVYTTLRRRLTLDAVLEQYVNRPLGKVDPRVLDILRMAVTEYLYLGKPPHAVVDNAVRLTQSVGAGAAKGFVNAVLRKVTAGPPAAPEGSLEVEYSHPGWIIRALRDVLGPAELPALLQRDNEPPRVTLAARAIDRAELPGEPTPWSPWGIYANGDPGAIPAVRDGRAGVQDLGSQLMVLALSRAQVDDDGRWLDMCAGPGGKAGLLVELAPELVCVEQHPHRARLVEQAVRGRAEVIIGDAAEIEGSYSRIMLDAPCSGLGVLRRRPEARWRRQPSDIPALAALQTRLLNHALDVCQPGGVVAYVTCSPHLAETDFIIEDVLRRRGDVVQEDAGELLAEVPDATDGKAIRLWPHRHDTDGMYLALLRRR
jgi:16S rRNA (cytosine967-C5)-methyltransferase